MKYDLGLQQKIKQAKEEAKKEFFEKRVQKLSGIYFPSDKYHPDFKEYFHKFLIFQSRKQMGIHIVTWYNMSTFEREFLMPEMEMCFEVLERATPFECGIVFESNNVLEEYNEVYFPKIMEIVSFMRKTFNEIDEQISKPIMDEINKNKKLSLQLPIGSDINFVIPKQTAVKDGKE